MGEWVVRPQADSPNGLCRVVCTLWGFVWGIAGAGTPVCVCLQGLCHCGGRQGVHVCVQKESLKGGRLNGHRTWHTAERVVAAQCMHATV